MADFVVPIISRIKLSAKNWFRVSVVIPAYNFADTIELSIKNIRAQTIEVAELVFVEAGRNGGSSRTAGFSVVQGKDYEPEH